MAKNIVEATLEVSKPQDWKINKLTLNQMNENWREVFIDFLNCL